MYYPKTGIGEIPEQIAGAVKAEGGKIHIGCPVVQIRDVGDGKMLVIYKQNDKHEEIQCSHVVSTIPLNSLLNILYPKPDPKILAAAGRLEYRSLLVLGMVTEKQKIINRHYIYTLNRFYNRISEANEFSPSTSPAEDNILVVEIPCHYGSKIWNMNEEELFKICIRDLSKDGFLHKEDVKQLILFKEPCAYPVYRKDFALHLNSILDYINQHERLSTLGRNGEFMYMDMDICMKQAFILADNFKLE